ncbi:MAG: GNAT family N-acetyltransferase [Burkholderiaceae bacterium]
MEPTTEFRYPVQWIDRWTLEPGQNVTVRPVLPQDAALQHDFFTHQMGKHSRYQRFMISMRELPCSTVQYFTRIDYHDHFALIAETFDDQGHRQVGDARFVRESGQPATAEFALAVADAWQGRSIGRRLLQALASAAQAQGVRMLFGDVLRDNLPMLGLARASGFAVRRHPDDARLLRVSRALQLPLPLPPANDAAWSAPVPRERACAL